MAGEDNGSLITDVEAEEVIKKQGALVVHRLPLMIISIVIIVASLTLLIMILMSLKGANTGLETILPFLKKPTTNNLNLPGQ